MEHRDLPKPFPLDIPLSPMELDQVDYPDAKYWTLEEWQQFPANANGEASSSKLGFLCNEDGDPVNKARLRVMTDMAKKLWSDLFRYRFDHSPGGSLVRLPMNTSAIICESHFRNLRSARRIGK
jgi:hypothetical protein